MWKPILVFFKTKFWSTFQERDILGFSTKKWDGAQGRALGLGTAQGLCRRVSSPCRKPTDPSTTVWLLATAISLCPSHVLAWWDAVDFTAAAQGWGSHIPWSEHRHSKNSGLKLDRRWKLSTLSFSLALTSPPFWAGCMGLRQKLAVPLWHFKIYLYYTWLLIKRRHLCCFLNGDHHTLWFNPC